MPACSRCRHDNEPGARFCNRCGAELRPASDGWSSAPAPERPAPRADLEPSTPPPSPRAGNVVLVLVLIGAVLVLLLVLCFGGFALYVMRAPSRPPPPAVAVPVAPAPAPAPAPVTPPPSPVATPLVPAPPAPPAGPDAPSAPAPAPPTSMLPPTATPPADPPIDRHVHLKITFDTWREGRKSFDVRAELVAQLRHYGIAVEADDAPAADGDLTVAWTESYGRQYSSVFGGQAEDPDQEDNDSNRGTGLYFQLELWPAGKPQPKEPLFEIGQDEDLGQTVHLRMGQTLYDVVVEYLQADEKPFPHCGALLSAALKRSTGDRDVQDLLLVPELGELTLKSLAVGGFKPRTAADRTRYAIAADDWDKAAAEGEDAVPVVIAYYQATVYRSPWDFNPDAAIHALGVIGGDKAGAFLAAELHSHLRAKPPEKPKPPAGAQPPADDEEMPAEEENWDPADYVESHNIDRVSALVEAVGLAKVKAAAPDLKLLATDKEESLNKAAREALKALGIDPPPAPTPAPTPNK